MRAKAGGDPHRFSGANIDRDPKRARLSEKLFVVDLAPDFSEAFEFEPARFANPGAQQDLVAERGRRPVIDLMA